MLVATQRRYLIIVELPPPSPPPNFEMIVTALQNIVLCFCGCFRGSVFLRLLVMSFSHLTAERPVIFRYFKR